MEFAREKFREMQTPEPPKTPIEFSMEIPTFDGWNLIASSKSKDLVELPEPLYSYTSRHHQNIVFHKNKEFRESNLNLFHNLIDKLESLAKLKKKLIKDLKMQIFGCLKIKRKN